MRFVRVTTGIAIWAALFWAGLVAVRARLTEDGHTLREIRSDLTELATVSRVRLGVTAEDPLRFVVGDPVFGRSADGTIEQLGEITAVHDGVRGGQPVRVRDARATSAEVVLYRDVDPHLYVLTQYTSPDSLAATFATMLPPAKRLEIANEIRRSLEQHRDEIVAQLKPLVEESLRESVRVVEQELTIALRKHREELTQLGAKYQRDMVTREVVPLVREEVLPIVRKHAQPLAEDIGKKLWDKVSIWRFGWRYLYDASPLPRRDRVQAEWDRFVNKEVIPELESRSDDMVRVVQRVFSDAARNPRIRSAVRKNVSAVIEDPEVHRIVWKIFREVMIESPRVREVLEKRWNSPEARQAFRLASDRFEPTAVRIGELLFGTPESGITPEFATVLRRQILLKDRRWLVLSERTDEQPAVSGISTLTVLSGGESADWPGRIRGSE